MPARPSSDAALPKVPELRLGAARDTAPADPPGLAAALRWRRCRFPDTLYRHAALLAVLVVIAYGIERLDIDLERLPGLLGRMGSTLAQRYFPPHLAHIAQPDYLHSVFETLQMSYLATV